MTGSSSAMQSVEEGSADPEERQARRMIDSQSTELEYLQAAEAFCFIARFDKQEATGPVIARASGSVVVDVTGRELLDFNSGMMAAALGHNHPKIIKALLESCETILHSSSSLFNTKEIELAQRLASVLEPPLRKSFFLLSGSDANEAAIAIARRVTGGQEVASPHVSFHGLSDTSRALTYSVPSWHKGHGPAQPGVHAILAPYCYRCPLKLSYPTCEIACLDTSFELLDAETSGPLAAILTEPMFSAGGVIEPPAGWLAKLKSACEDRGALLILDEQQTGLAKTGSMWMHQQEGVVPDVLTMAKHFGGGVAISAVSTSDEIEEKATADGFVFSHSHAADPMGCNSALATLNIIDEESLPEKARTIGGYWRGHLETLQAKHEMIGDIRGRGLIQGIELVHDRITKEPNVTAGPAIAQACLDNGLIFSVRRGGAVLRFVPPFSTSREQADLAAEILDGAITAAEKTVVLNS